VARSIRELDTPEEREVVHLGTCAARPPGGQSVVRQFLGGSSAEEGGGKDGHEFSRKGGQRPGSLGGSWGGKN